MILSKMYREVRAFANGTRVSTGVHLKKGTFLQVHPVNLEWGHESSWRQVVMLQNKGKTIEFFHGDRKTVMKAAEDNLCMRKQAENWMNLFVMREKILDTLPTDLRGKLEDYMRSGDMKKLA